MQAPERPVATDEMVPPEGAPVIARPPGRGGARAVAGAVRLLSGLALIGLVATGSMAAAQELPLPPLPSPVPVPAEICALSVLVVGEAPLGCPDEDDPAPSTPSERSSGPSATQPAIPTTSTPLPGRGSAGATPPGLPRPAPGPSTADVGPGRSTGSIGGAPPALVSVDAPAVSAARRLLIGAAVIALGLHVGITSAPRRRVHADAQ